MKKLLYPFLCLSVLLIVDSCTKKETTPPSVGETNAVLLAGAKGSSKSWNLVSISEAIDGGLASTVTSSSGMPACETDNVYLFNHDAGQTYQQSEGTISCASTDGSKIESGNWAFSEDGLSLFVESIVYPSAAQFQNEDPSSGYFLAYMILAVGKAWTVKVISATSLTITYSGTYTDSNNATHTYVDTLILNSKN
ncbi:MAG TPA: hypothetical protein VL728_12125 [Cyclobacteriaceae bacterium]|jgi:hypothetical protein|nr:hypothetical protein [Cyclobacteriaceae bacterium]